MSEPHQALQPSSAFRLLVPASLALALAGVGAFWWASQRAPASITVGATEAVTVTAGACQPMELTVAAGRRSFQITNASDRPIEWEILDGVMVVAERENIVPGLHQSLNANLAPGDYAMTCGLPSNPRGVLHVTPSDEWTSARSQLELRDFLGALSEYKVYIALQGAQAVAAANTLRDAIAAGDLAGAQAAWRAARIPYKRIEPLAYRLSDLENVIDPSAGTLKQREADPGFTGYHRLEYGLFRQESLDSLGPVADRLVADLDALLVRLKAFPVDPDRLAALPGDMARQLADGQIIVGEDLYAKSDLDDLAASLEGIGKLVSLLDPVVAHVSPAATAKVDERLAAAQAELEALRGPQGFPSYDKVDEAARDRLASVFGDLSDGLDGMTSSVGAP